MLYSLYKKLVSQGIMILLCVTGLVMATEQKMTVLSDVNRITGVTVHFFCDEAINLDGFQRCGIDVTRDSNTVKNLLIKLSANMPGHMHGLPTQPVVSWNDDLDRYEIKGLRFSMPGDWKLLLHIRGKGKTNEMYTVSFDITI